MKKRLRFLSLVTALLLAATSMAACNNTKTASSNAPSPSATDSKVDAAKAPTLVWWQIGNTPADLAEGLAKMNEYTAEKIGVKVDIKVAGWDVWSDKIQTIVSTGEQFDMMFTNSDKYVAHASLGAFADISDLVKSETPNLYSFVPENLWKAVKIKGKIYSVPTYKDSSQTQYFVWDKAIVDKYNVDYKNLKTLKDLDPVLRKIKEGEEKATGSKVYPFPLDKNGFNGMLFYYDNYVKYDDKTATAKNTYERQEVIDTLTMLHQWYQDGIINPDASTLGQSPKYRICYSAQGFPGADANWSKDGGYTAISSPWGGPIYSTSSILGSVNAISANSQYKKEALKYLELANTDTKLRNMLAYGIQDKHWKDNGDKTITKLTDTWNFASYSQASFFSMSPIAPNAANQWELLKKQNEQAVPSVILGFSLDNSKIETETVNVNAVIKKYEPEMLTGVKDPATFLPQFNQELKAAGLDKVLEETQKQVNTFLGK